MLGPLSRLNRAAGSPAINGQPFKIQDRMECHGGHRRAEAISFQTPTDRLHVDEGT